jgi:hypothetical protein
MSDADKLLAAISETGAFTCTVLNLLATVSKSVLGPDQFENQLTSMIEASAASNNPL